MARARRTRNTDELLTVDPDNQSAAHQEDVDELASTIHALPAGSAERNQLEKRAQKSARAALCWSENAREVRRLRSLLRTAKKQRDDNLKALHRRVTLAYRAARTSGTAGAAAAITALTPLAPLGGWVCAAAAAILVPCAAYATYRGMTQYRTIDLADAPYRAELDAAHDALSEFVTDAHAGRIPIRSHASEEEDERYDVFHAASTQRGHLTALSEV